MRTGEEARLVPTRTGTACLGVIAPSLDAAGDGAGVDATGRGSGVARLAAVPPVPRPAKLTLGRTEA